MTMWLSVAVCLVGLVIYALASNVKAAELGRLMFGCGLLVTLFQTAPRLVELFT